jgi:hypothetical protein
MSLHQYDSRPVVFAFENLYPVTGCPSLLPGPLGLIFGNAHELGKVLIDDFYLDLLVAMSWRLHLVELVPGMRLLLCGI